MSEPKFVKQENGQSRAVVKTDEELAAEANQAETPEKKSARSKKAEKKSEEGQE